MENEYIYVIVGVLLLVMGLFLGIQIIKFFFQELTFKLENALESQLELNKNYLADSIEQMITISEGKIDFIEQINEILKKIKIDLTENSQKIKYLNQMCNKRQELESKIIKLKKIIQRLEKKQ
jgi:hypothetical protein